jgi:hypothetical protein
MFPQRRDATLSQLRRNGVSEYSEEWIREELKLTEEEFSATTVPLSELIDDPTKLRSDKAIADHLEEVLRYRLQKWNEDDWINPLEIVKGFKKAWAKKEVVDRVIKIWEERIKELRENQRPGEEVPINISFLETIAITVFELCGVKINRLIKD